jgi:hypothetical protein
MQPATSKPATPKFSKLNALSPHGVAATLACAAAAISVLADPGMAATTTGAVPALPEAAPVAACPGASTVSGVAGYTVPAPSSKTRSVTHTIAQFGTITETGTVCVYVGTPTLSSLKSSGLRYVMLVLGRVSRTLPSSSVDSYLKNELQGASSTMPAGLHFQYRFGTQFGVATLLTSGDGTVGGLNYVVNGALGYRATKYASAEIVGGSQAKANALEHIALNEVGI